MHCQSLQLLIALLNKTFPLTLSLRSPPATLPLCHTVLCSQSLPATPALTRIFTSSFLTSLSGEDLERSFPNQITVVLSTYSQSIKVQRKQLKEESSFCLTTYALPPISLKKKLPSKLVSLSLTLGHRNTQIYLSTSAIQDMSPNHM